MIEQPRPSVPTFATLDEERTYRKQHLAAAFRVFGRFGFSEGTAGHITARDPELLDHFWVNPYGMHFSRIKVSDLLLVNDAGEVVEGNRPVNRAGFAIHSQVHAARPDVVAAAHTHSHPRPCLVLARPAARPDQPGCLLVLRGPRPLRRLHRGRPRPRRGRAPGEDARADEGDNPPEPRPVDRRRDRRRGGLVVPQDGADLPGAAPRRGSGQADPHPPRVRDVDPRAERPSPAPVGGPSSPSTTGSRRKSRRSSTDPGARRRRWPPPTAPPRGRRHRADTSRPGRARRARGARRPR